MNPTVETVPGEVGELETPRNPRCMAQETVLPLVRDANRAVARKVAGWGCTAG